MKSSRLCIVVMAMAVATILLAAAATLPAQVPQTQDPSTKPAARPAPAARMLPAPTPVPGVPSGVVEPMYRAQFVRFKSPGPGMSFTAGLPVRVLADGIDEGGWQGKTKKMEAEEVRVFVDGQLKATVPAAPDGYNYFDTTLTDLPAGAHVLALESTNFGNIVAKSLPITITVEAPAVKASTLTLTEDLVLKGSTDLNWDNVRVNGAGFKVRSDKTWTGKVLIRNALVTGLGATTTPGIDLTTTGGSVTIENTIFEATGAVFFRVDGPGDVTIRDNEFRASNLIRFVSSDPGKSPVIVLTGSAAGKKAFQGNKIGAGIVRFEGMHDWIIGGDTDAQSNILIGPRCVLDLTMCRHCIIRGNYMHHDYAGGWSQGFNLFCDRSEDLLAEHNVIRHSSWPIQSFAGEFRYNVVIDSGHNWVRGLATGTKMHHNLFVHNSYGGGVNSGVWLYKGPRDVAIYNNTFDAGAPVTRAFANPIIEISQGCSLSTLRNNVFMGMAKPENGSPRPVVDRGIKESADSPRITYADYNCFFNPSAPGAANYAEGIAEKPGGGAHDVSADPKFAQGTIMPYPINQDLIWNRKFTVSQVLGYYRQRYAPAPGSPLLSAGDPADGPGSYIGAIGPTDSGVNAPADHFGHFCDSAPPAAGQ